MKKTLIITLSLLFLISCSSKDSGDDQTYSPEVLTTDSVSSTDSEGKATESVNNEESSSTEEAAQMSEEEVLAIKKLFEVADVNAKEAIGMEFIQKGNSLTATVSKRCQTSDLDDLKSCLTFIKSSLQSYLNSTSEVMKYSTMNEVKVELTKYNLATKWFKKISQSLYIVR